MKALVGAFNQEKALVGDFSVIVKPMDCFTALLANWELSPSMLIVLDGVTPPSDAAPGATYTSIQTTPDPAMYQGSTRQ